jgi:general stress protein 26
MSHAEAIQKLNELVKNIRFAMLTTQQNDGSLRSRPMVTQDVDSNGCLWFITAASTHKMDEIGNHHQVNVSYAVPDEQLWVSVSGMAETVRDRAQAERLWNPIYRAYFPKGLDDPELALLKVRITAAEYWDSPSNRMVQLAEFEKAIATGERPKVGKHEKLDVA